MLWPAAKAALQSHVETQWAAGAYAFVPLIWENKNFQPPGDMSAFVWLSIEGTYAEKGIFGGVGKRSSVEAGLLLFSAFVEAGTGAEDADGMVSALTTMTELQVISNAIYCEGGNPPSPAESTTVNIPGVQPGGSYYRVGGSVPFIITGAR